MMTSVLTFMLLLVTVFHFSTVSAQTFSFSQPATGPSSVCEGSDVTLQCVIIQTNPNNMTVVTTTIWSRNGMPVQVNNGSGNFFIPNHSTVFNSTTGAITDLVITDVTLEDDNTVYTCTAASASMTSSLVLNVTEIPPVEDLMVTDQCTAITANWSVTEGPCTNLSYIVTLLSPDGGTVKGPFTTNDIDYNFTDVETLSGTFNVSVVSVDNERGASVAVIDVGLSPVTNIRNVSTCVTSLNISWDAPNITCGVVSYELSVSQYPNEEDAVEPTFYRFFSDIKSDNRSLNVTGLNNSLPVTVNVTAIDRVGRRNDIVSDLQLRTPEDVGLICRESPQRCNVMPSHFDTTANVAGFDRKITWQEPVTNSCTTLPILGYYINITFMNGTNRNYTYTSRFVNATEGDSMGMFTFYYSQLFEEMLLPNTRYVLTVVPTDTDASAPAANDTTKSSQQTSSSEEPNIMIIRIIIIVILVVLTSVIIIIVGVILCRRHLKEKVKVPIEQEKSDENEANSDQHNQDTVDYAYVSNGPRGIVFHSSEMPQTSES